MAGNSNLVIWSEGTLGVLGCPLLIYVIKGYWKVQENQLPVEIIHWDPYGMDWMPIHRSNLHWNRVTLIFVSPKYFLTCPCCLCFLFSLCLLYRGFGIFLQKLTSHLKPQNQTTRRGLDGVFNSSTPCPHAQTTPPSPKTQRSPLLLTRNKDVVLWEACHMASCGQEPLDFFLNFFLAIYTPVLEMKCWGGRVCMCKDLLRLSSFGTRMWDCLLFYRSESSPPPAILLPLQG